MADGLLVQGYDHGDAISSLDEFEELYGAKVSYRARQQVATRTGGQRGTQEPVDVDGDDRDVLEIETADGLVQFMTVDQARRDVRARRSRQLEALFDARRGASPIVGVTRSSFDVVDPDIKAAVAELNGELEGLALDRLARTAISPVARAAMRRIAEWIDRPVADEAEPAQRRKKPKTRGLYTIDESLLLEPRQRIDRDLDGDGPTLLMLHGTFSHTEAAFHGLRGTHEWTDLCGRFGGRMFCLEHATLSKTPVQNALDAARLLPRGARLHLLSHSRGGLVGEALSLTAAQVAAGRQPDLDAYRQSVEHLRDDRDRDSLVPDMAALESLHDVMAERDLRVERFVRVACPARGTLLASRRVDRYASYLFNLFRLVPGLQGTGVVELVKLLLLTFLDQRSDVRAVPGLEAQMPESAYIATLNTRAGVVADDHMAAIAGDVEGSGLAKRLKVLGADLFFREDHDMVVNTSAMVEGIPRQGRQVAMFKGPAYSHSNYFTDQVARAAATRWLSSKNLDGVSGFTTSPHTRSRGDLRLVPAETVGTVIVVPDLMGSTISVGDRPAWPDPSALAAIGVQDFLDRAACPGQVTGLTAPYDELINGLRATHEVLTFAYDFRSPLAEVASQLNAWLEEQTLHDPVHLVAHGAGCVVVTLAHDAAGSVVRNADGKRILLSPPLAGTSSTAARREGRDALSASLALVGGIEPAEAGAYLRGGCPALDELSAGLSVDEVPEWNGYVAVFGRAAKTWTRDPDGTGRLVLTARGDGHVVHPAENDARFKGLDTHYLPVPFDRLVNAPSALDLITGILSGHTKGDSPTTESPREAGELSDAPEAFPMVFPTADDLVWAGMHAPVAPERIQSRLMVSIVHGNLTSAPEKLIVGTQYGTPMGGAEKALDERLDGALQRHRMLGQYPGPLGTCQLFVRPERPGAGAAVIGIGDPGDLSPGHLAAGVAQAVLRLVAARASEDDEPDEIELATVLIGTAGLGTLPVASAVGALITGVRRANRRIRDQDLPQHVATLRIYELYEDRAIEAQHAAAKLRTESAADEDDVLDINTVVQEGPDGRAGTPRADYHADRWRTIRVSALKPEDENDELRELSFTETGRSAGSPTLISRGQHRVIDELVEQCIGTPTAGEQIYNTLYELLVPRSMKGQGRPSEHLMYMLDDDAASLPLEMLATRSFDDGVRPIAIEVGIIRRLESTRIRDLIRPSPGRKALVIGDPYLGPGKPRLEAAVHEANAVANLLETRGWEVNRLISRDANDRTVQTQAVLNALFAHEYRIIHIAAHGEYDGERSERSGVCIGPDRFLTSHEFEQMQTTPDLVFLNCCHLGSGIARPDRLASSVSRKLIDNGIRTVVAAGWTVDDAAAATFATDFYDGLLRGENLGTATLSARKLVHSTFGQSTNTWGAYQVYGEPAFQLAQHGPYETTSDPMSRRGFREKLETLAETSRLAGASEEPALVADLEDVRRCGERYGWLQGREHQAIGNVWRALGRYEDAIRSYNDALSCGGGTVGFDIIDQLIGAHAQQGADNIERTCDHDHFNKAAELLELWRTLATQTGTSEPDDPALLRAQANLLRQRLWSHCIAGADHSDLVTALHAASAAYKLAAAASTRQSAHTADGRSTDRIQLTAVILDWLIALHDAGGETVDPSQAATLQTSILQLRQHAATAPWSSSPCDRLQLPSTDLALHLVTGSPATAEVVTSYAAVFDKSLGRRECENETQWINLIHRCLPAGGPVAHERRQSLEQLERALEAWIQPAPEAS